MRVNRVSTDLREIVITVKKTLVKKVDAKLAFKGPRLVKVKVEAKNVKRKNIIDYRV